MKKTRQVTALFLAALTTVAFTACGAPKTTTGGETATPDSQAGAPEKAASTEAGGTGKSITVWTWYSEQLKEKLIPAFEAKTGYKVNSITLPSDELEQKMLAAIAAGSGAPDVSSLQGYSIQKFIANGGLTDLTERITPIKDDFPAYKIANDTGKDGKIYGMPIDCGPVALYYNAPAFEAAGVSPTLATWDEWIEAGKKLKEKGYSLYNLSIAGDGERIQIWTQQQGSSYFDENGQATLNTPEFINALSLMKKVYDAGVTADIEEWSPPYADSIANAKTATIVGAAWYMNTFRHSFDGAQDKGWQITELPQFTAGAGAASNAGGSELIIPDQVKDKDAAWAFIEYYVASIEGRKIAMDSLGEFPAYLPLYKEADILEKTSPFFGEQKVYKFFSDEMPKVPTTFRYMSPYSEVSKMISATLPKVIDGTLTPEAAAAECQKQAEAIVKNYK